MKCIKNKKTGTVSRVEDKTADSEVTKGLATYCTKQEWKVSLTAKERKSIMDHNGGDPSVKKTDIEKAKSKGKKKLFTMDEPEVQTTEPKSDNPAPVYDGNPVIFLLANKEMTEPTNTTNEPPKTESKAKRNKKDKEDAPAKDDTPKTAKTAKTAKTDKKPMINKPKVKKAKEE